jgi:hypothetical protein
LDEDRLGRQGAEILVHVPFGRSERHLVALPVAQGIAAIQADGSGFLVALAQPVQPQVAFYRVAKLSVGEVDRIGGGAARQEKPEQDRRARQDAARFQASRY